MKYFQFILFLLPLCFIACGPETIPVLVQTSYKENILPLQDITFINDSVGYAIGGHTWNTGIILSTHDAGLTWKTDTTFIPALLSITKWGDSMVIAVGYSGNLFINKHNKGWYGVRVFNWSEFQEIAVTPDQDMFISTGSSFHGGQIIHLDKWFNIDTIYQTDNEIKSIANTNQKDMVAVGYGAIFNSSDKGKTWKRNRQDGDYYQKVVFTTEKTGYTVGFAGSILKTHDGGISWQQLKRSKNHSFGNEPFLDVVCKNENTIYVCGQHGTLWKSEDGGENWKQFEIFTDDHLTGIDITGNLIWLSSSSGKIYKVID
ncbi:MAG TPA: YCF48-related protein [Saprospiraceae bacterium]|nr:YCF48-related protein [Saprospiraceae bacterium]